MVWLIVVNADGRFRYFLVRLLLFYFSRLFIDRLELMSDFEQLQYSPVDFVRTLEHALHKSICVHCPSLFIALIDTAGSIIWEFRGDWTITNGKLTHLNNQLSLAASKKTQNRNCMLSLSSYEPTQVQLSFDLCRSHSKLLSIAQPWFSSKAEAVKEETHSLNSLCVP